MKQEVYYTCFLLEVQLYKIQTCTNEGPYLFLIHKLETKMTTFNTNG